MLLTRAIYTYYANPVRTEHQVYLSQNLTIVNFQAYITEFYGYHTGDLPRIFGATGLLYL